MGPRVWFVILSLLPSMGCTRAEPAPQADAVAPPPDARLGPSGPDAAAPSPPAPTPNTPPRANRPNVRARVPVLERRGDSEGPIPFRVVEPGDVTARTPLVIALHGRGDTAEGFARLAMRLGMDARVIVGEGPMPFGLAGGRQWFEAGAADAAAEVRARVKDLAALVDKLGKLYPEAGRPALFGFSQGAVVALQAAHDIPDRFRAVAALSGFLAIEEGGAASPSGALPVLITAGTKDHIIPQERSWSAAVVLERQGFAVERFAFEGPHSVPPAVEDELVRFLMAHR